MMTPPAPVLVIAGSSRNDGNTRALTDKVIGKLASVSFVNLDECAIAPYDYEHRYGEDEFAPIAEAMANAEAIVFASPVYWYSMSGQMKIFFDRLTDLTETHKPIGKSLAGKSAFLIATGGTKAPPDCFEPPFSATARYFNMNWGGMLYGQAGAPFDHEEIAEFAARIAAVTGGLAMAAE